jgi:hypothetical protein
MGIVRKLGDSVCFVRKTTKGKHHCITFGIILFIISKPKYQKTQRLGNWTCFCPQEMGGTATLLGPLERATK